LWLVPVDSGDQVVEVLAVTVKVHWNCGAVCR
jgi:hypothetical protein